MVNGTLPMKVIYSSEHALHSPQTFLSSGRLTQSPEKPERGEILHAAAIAAGCEILAPVEHGVAPAASIHTPAYIHFLQNIHTRWQELPNASDEVIPNIHPVSRTDSYPTSAVGQAGFHLGDTACPVGAGTYAAALAGSHCATTAADLVLDGEPVAYALCRPPGHHASADLAGGFCFLNNSAIAAQRLRMQHERVAIIDVDLHHGNGTQDIVQGNPKILFCSSFQHPLYPFNGTQQCPDNIHNVALSADTGSVEYRQGVEPWFDVIDNFAPQLIFISAGFDGHAADDISAHQLFDTDYHWLTEKLVDLAEKHSEGRIISLLEGGYAVNALGRTAVAHLKALLKSDLH
mgnify:CR=1 FL=1